MSAAPVRGGEGACQVYDLPLINWNRVRSKNHITRTSSTCLTEPVNLISGFRMALR